MFPFCTTLASAFQVKSVTSSECRETYTWPIRGRVGGAAPAVGTEVSCHQAKACLAVPPASLVPHICSLGPPSFCCLGSAFWKTQVKTPCFPSLKKLLLKSFISYCHSSPGRISLVIKSRAQGPALVDLNPGPTPSQLHGLEVPGVGTQHHATLLRGAAGELSFLSSVVSTLLCSEASG